MYLNALGQELLESSQPVSFPTGTTGTSRNDVFHGTRGQTLTGGEGDDTYHLWDNSARVVERARQGIDTVYAEFWGAAFLADNIENLVLASSGSTAGTGNALDNIIIAGKVGAELNGLGGNDVLVGGDGGDLFRIVAGNGSDAIVGFESNHDVVLLNGYGITTFEQILSAGRQEGADVRLTFANQEQLVLRDVELSSLNPWDFGFAAPAPSGGVGSRAMSGITDAYNAHGWYVLNGLWNLGDASKGSTIRSVFDPKDMTAGVVFTWSLPQATTTSPIIKGFPEVQFGVNPHGAYAGNPTDVARVFPILVGDIVSLKADFDVSFSGNLGGFNVAYDIWLTSVPNGDASTITNEIMVWLHEGDFPAYGTPIGTYTHDGLTANIYRNGTYTAFVFDQDVTTGVLDIGDLLRTLKEMGIVSDREYLASVELGAEVVSGIGSLTVHNLDLEVVTRGENGTIVIENVTGAGTTVREVVAPTDDTGTETPGDPAGGSETGPQTPGTGEGGSGDTPAVGLVVKSSEPAPRDVMDVIKIHDVLPAPKGGAVGDPGSDWAIASSKSSDAMSIARDHSVSALLATFDDDAFFAMDPAAAFALHDMVPMPASSDFFLI